MGISNDDVREILSGLREQGIEAGLRDVSCAVLVHVYGDRLMAYRSVFGEPPSEGEYNAYWVERKTIAIEHEVGKFFQEKSDDQTVSFDDLKQGLIDDMNSLIELRDSRNVKDGKDCGPVLEPKEMAQVVARIADIRVKLTEKFNTTERVVEQRVVVEQKYSGVCEYCGHEIAIQPVSQ